MSASIGRSSRSRSRTSVVQRLPLEILSRRDVLAIGILEHLAEHPALVVTDGLSIEIDCSISQLRIFSILSIGICVAVASSSLVGWRPSVPVSMRRRLGQAVLRIDHVHGEPDLTALVGERAADVAWRIPPARIGREPESAAIVVALDRLEQAEVALLDQIRERPSDRG